VKDLWLLTYHVVKFFDGGPNGAFGGLRKCKRLRGLPHVANKHRLRARIAIKITIAAS
jgi:hypothetical protein